MSPDLALPLVGGALALVAGRLGLPVAVAALPWLAAFFPLKLAVLGVLPAGLASYLVTLLNHPRALRAAGVWRLAVYAGLGATAGALLQRLVPGEALRVLLGLTFLALGLRQWSRRPTAEASPVLAGGIAGFLLGLVGLDTGLREDHLRGQGLSAAAAAAGATVAALAADLMRAPWYVIDQAPEALRLGEPLLLFAGAVLVGGLLGQMLRGPRTSRPGRLAAVALLLVGLHLIVGGT